MPHFISKEFANLILQTLNGGAIAPPSQWQIKLYTTNIQELGSQSFNYSAALVPPSSFGTVAGESIQNVSQILFPANTGVLNWQEACACSIGPVGESYFYFYGILNLPQITPPSGQLNFQSGEFTIRFNPNNIGATLVNNILGILNGTTFTPPSNLYIGLGSAAPNNQGDISEITALPRVAVPCTTGQWASHGSSYYNSTVIQIPASTSEFNIQSFGLWSQPRAAGSSDDNLPWWFGGGIGAKPVHENDVLSIPSGGLEICVNQYFHDNSSRCQ